MKNTTLIAAPLAIFAALGAAPAIAGEEYTNASGGTFQYYGHFDPGYLHFNDGVQSYNDLADNSASNSRAGIWIRQPTSAGLLSFNLETALGFRQSASLSQTVTPPALSWNRTSIRKADISLKTDRYGTFSAGQGSMATDGAAEVDQSGTALVNYASVPETAGSYQFRTTAGALSGRTIGAAFSDFDGGRRGRIRYDTPSFNGFSVAMAYGNEILATASNDTYYDVALRYSGNFGGAKVKGALGWGRRDRLGVYQDDTVASASLLLPSGFNVTLAGGNRKGGGSFGYGKLGWIGNWFSVGSTAVSVDYYDGNDQTVAGSNSTSVGVGAVQKFDRYNVEAYLGYHNYSLTETAATYRDASSVLFGARWKF